MNAKEYLSQAYRMNEKIRSMQDQIDSYRELLTSIHVRLGDEPVKHTRNEEIMHDTIMKIVAEEEKLNQQIDALVDKKREIAAVISRVRDDDLRLILEKRYLLFQTHEEIADDMKYAEKSITRKLREAISVVQGILDGIENREEMMF